MPRYEAMHRVKLNKREMVMAGLTGLLRWIESRLKCDTPANGQDLYNAIADDVAGAMAEAAVAKRWGVFWLGHWNQYGRSDVAGCEVRHTRYHAGHLLVQRDNPVDATYVLVTGMPPEFIIRGWQPGEEAKQEKYWNTDRFKKRPCYSVPQAELLDMNDLEESLREQGLIGCLMPPHEAAV